MTCRLCETSARKNVFGSRDWSVQDDRQPRCGCGSRSEIGGCDRGCESDRAEMTTGGCDGDPCRDLRLLCLPPRARARVLHLDLGLAAHVDRAPMRPNCCCSTREVVVVVVV